MRLAAAICPRLPRGRYRATRWLARRAHGPFIAQLPRRLLGARLQCDPRNWATTQAYFVGVFEPQETAVVQAILRPGSTFVDVGANWGYFTLIASPSVGPRGSVIAIEPEPRMCEALRANIALNDFPNVTVCQLAAIEREARIPFLPYDEATDSYGMSRVASAGDCQDRIVTVQGRPLDDLLQAHGVRRVSLLKMDVEGAEARALAGLHRSLTTGVVNRLLLEVHPAQLAGLGSSVSEVFDLLTRAEFQGWRLDHSPETSRRAAYARRLDARSYLRPLDPGEPLDAWPHFLWTRKGLAPLDP